MALARRQAIARNRANNSRQYAALGLSRFNGSQAETVAPKRRVTTRSKQPVKTRSPQPATTRARQPAKTRAQQVARTRARQPIKKQTRRVVQTRAQQPIKTRSTTRVVAEQDSQSIRGKTTGKHEI